MIDFSFNLNITWEIIQAHLEINWYYLSQNPNITWEIIQAHPEIKWDWYFLINSHIFTLELIKSQFIDSFGEINVNLKTYLDEDWGWGNFSNNLNITWDIVKAHLDKKWNTRAISNHPNITWEIIKANPNFKWDHIGISENPNITYEIIKNNPEIKWDWRFIRLNEFTFQNKLIRDQCRKELTAINLIKRNFLKAFWDPAYQLGRKRL